MKPPDKLRVMTDLDLREISLVDHPMQDPARVAILKRGRDNPDVLKRIAITSQTGGHAHSVLTANTSGGENRIGQTSYVDGHTHDWVMDEAGNIFIADAMGHSHGIAVLTKNQTGAPATGEEPTPAGTTKAAPSGAEISMTPEQMAALQKAATESEAKISSLNAAVLRAQQTLALDAEQRAHFDTLKGAEQDAFLSLTAEQRADVVKNLRDSNAVVYKSTDGTEYRKNDDPRLVKMARENDARAVELAREQAIRKQADLEKRAADEFKTLGGDVMVKAALLGAVEGIADATTRGKVLEALKAHDAGLGAAFTRVGTSTPANVNKRAGDRLDELSKAYADTHKCDLGKAYEAVIRTPEGRNLYEEHRAGK